MAVMAVIYTDNDGWVLCHLEIDMLPFKGKYFTQLQDNNTEL